MRTVIVGGVIATALGASWDVAPLHLVALYVLLAVPAWLHGFSYGVDKTVTFFGGKR